jgi:hypothetical protein
VPQDELGGAEGEYSLPFVTTPTLELATHIEDLEEIRVHLHGLGVETQNTRFDRYARYLRNVQQDSATDPSRVFRNVDPSRFRSPTDWYLYVIREVHELMWILAGLKIANPPGIGAKLADIVGGMDFAAFDVDSKSRDTQFELRIASYFLQAGCEVDLSLGTDVVALTASHAFYVECKRISSAKQVQKRVSEAKGQLMRRMPSRVGQHRNFGCIALDVTSLAFPHNGLTVGMTPEHGKDVVQAALRRVTRQHARSFNHKNCRKLLSYWLQIHIPSLALRPYNPTTRFSTLHLPSPGIGRRDLRAVDELYAMFEAVSVADARANPPVRLRPRTSVTIPSGTVCYLDYDRLCRLIDIEHPSEAEQSEIIGSLDIQGKLLEFTFFEFRLLPPGVVEIWIAGQAEATSRSKADLDLLAHLMLQRDPYHTQT